MRLKPPPGKKLVRDWTGMRVVSRRTMRNAAATLPAGTAWEVVDAGRIGLRLRSAPCACCGVSVMMTGVSHDDVDVAPPNDPAPTAARKEDGRG